MSLCPFYKIYVEQWMGGALLLQSMKNQNHGINIQLILRCPPESLRAQVGT